MALSIPKIMASKGKVFEPPGYGTFTQEGMTFGYGTHFDDARHTYAVSVGSQLPGSGKFASRQMHFGEFGSEDEFQALLKRGADAIISEFTKNNNPIGIEFDYAGNGITFEANGSVTFDNAGVKWGQPAERGDTEEWARKIMYETKAFNIYNEYAHPRRYVMGVEEPKPVDHMPDLLDRLKRGSDAILTLAEKVGGDEQVRTLGKRDGLLLAIEYIEELQEGSE